VVFGGEEVDFGRARHLLELRRHMAAVMQEPLLCRMSVRRNVALGLRFRGLPRPEIENRVDTWLSRLSVSHLGNRPASKLSGGEAQRTSLARAMALNPEVLFLDEPFAALDAPTRQSLLEEFRTVLADSGVTAVYATHDRGEALGLGDRVAVLMGGRVAQVGATEAVFSRPEQVEVARFVGIETLIPGRVTGTGNGMAQVECGEVRLEAEGDCGEGEDVYVSVRPEEIELHDDGSPAAGEAGNVLVGRVTKTVPAETHYRVEIDCGARVVAAISRVRFREMALEPGRRVHATFSARAAHLIRRTRDERS
jgi:tungstate transport system ATP-binding protein